MANKQDLIAKVAEATELTKKDSAAAVDAVFAKSQLLKFQHSKLVKLLKKQLNNCILKSHPRFLGWFFCWTAL